ncbi:alpha/beta hydrolase [Streptomyces sp. NPDC004610]|uniref:alpha/beta hydrolase n=1 Tax=unclassified Streptomyces TaxID=2593676 RepID=UPI0033B14262
MRTDVTFLSSGLKLAGHLYAPDDGVPGPRPALVVGHPGSGVKEQAAGLYARRMAEQGYVTLAFDAAYQGESEGEPRSLENPNQRVEDFKAAVSFLTTRGEVDTDRIGALGICASGGYTLATTAADHRIKAVGTVSGVDIARQFRLGADGAQDPAVFQGMLDAAAAARTTEAEGADAQTFQLFPDTIEQARAAGGEHGAEGFEYYCTPRAQHPRSGKFLPWVSVDHMAGFDAFHAVGLIGPRPVLLVVGSAAVTSWMAVEAFQQVEGPKELHWIEGASHVDLYDKEPYVSQAVERLTEFYGAHLAK